MGHVKRVHGDLHLRNLLLIDGQPVLFDALEFDERLATCDVLYDLAFLVMDLCHRGLERQANVAMTAYLLAAAGDEDAGLAALPLFLSIRAAIRAMVLVQTDQVTGKTGTSTIEARRYLTQAVGYWTALPRSGGGGRHVGHRQDGPGAPSGTRHRPLPRCGHLRTDTERKVGAAQVDYAPASRSAIYDRMLGRAANLLAAGRSVILDGTFLDGAQRTAATELAQRLRVGFRGLWLTAPLPVLFERVASRQDDASDADAAVVSAQACLEPAAPQDPHWSLVDASGTPRQTLAAAHKARARA